MKAEYKELLKRLERRAYSAALTRGIITLFVITFVLVGLTIVAYVQNSGESHLPLLVVSLIGSVSVFMVTVFCYLM